MTAPLELFENAVHAWFADAVGIETVWRMQSAPQPELPFASLRIIDGPTPIGRAITCQTELQGQPLGQEIKLESRLPCSVTVSCQVFVAMPDARNPGYNARTYIVLALTALSLQGVREALWSQGVSVITTGMVQDLSALAESEHESRANLDVTFGIVLTAAEYVGYIETVQLKSTGMDLDFDVSIEQ